MSNNKKIAVLVVAAALLGGVIGSLIQSPAANAGLSDLLKSFLEGLNVPPVPVLENAGGDLAAEEKPAYVPAVDYEEKIMNAAEKSEPAVVAIVVSKDVPVVENCPYDPFGDLPEEFRQYFGGDSGFTRPCQKGTARRDVGGGSGFIIESDGMIVTNKHVVTDTKASYTVFTNDGKKHAAKVLARDPILDFAVLKIEASGLDVLPLGDSDSIRLGQSVIAIGNSLGEFRNTVSVGVVSGLRRNVTAEGGGNIETIEGVIQTDAAINPGNSGGPLLNLKGEVVGINTAMATGAQNIGFAIPINQVKRAIKSIKDNGKIVVPYMGVRYLMITEERAEKEKLQVKEGALVRGNGDEPPIMTDSPAAKAGLKAGDIIMEVNGEKITFAKSLSSVIQKYSVGDAVNLTVLRGGEALEFGITLEERKF